MVDVNLRGTLFGKLSSSLSRREFAFNWLHLPANPRQW